jgi:hypothetical protein
MMKRMNETCACFVGAGQMDGRQNEFGEESGFKIILQKY